MRQGARHVGRKVAGQRLWRLASNTSQVLDFDSCKAVQGQKIPLLFVSVFLCLRREAAKQCCEGHSLFELADFLFRGFRLTREQLATVPSKKD